MLVTFDCISASPPMLPAVLGAEAVPIAVCARLYVSIFTCLFIFVALSCACHVYTRLVTLCSFFSMCRFRLWRLYLAAALWRPRPTACSAHSCSKVKLRIESKQNNQNSRAVCAIFLLGWTEAYLRADLFLTSRHLLFVCARVCPVHTQTFAFKPFGVLRFG